jgi:hypothetical protein
MVELLRRDEQHGAMEGAEGRKEHTMKRFLLGVALVLTMVVFAGTLVFLAAGEIGGIGPVNRTAALDQTLPVAGTPTIALTNSNGAIAITRGEENVVAVHAIKRASSDVLLDTIHVDIAPTGVRVTIRTTYDRPSWRHLLGGANRSVTYEIRLPARATIAPARTCNGAFDVTGISGPLDLHSSNGAIAVRNVDGDVTARTSNGKIAVSGGSGALTLAASNGPVEMQEMRAGVLDVQTSNGRIIFTGSLAAGSRNRLTTSNGSVTLTLPPDLAANVDLKTSNGTIGVGYPLTTQPDGEIARTSVRGTIGGGGSQLVVRTSNGSITLTS